MPIINGRHLHGDRLLPTLDGREERLEHLLLVNKCSVNKIWKTGLIRCFFDGIPNHFLSAQGACDVPHRVLQLSS